jgi:L-iditol 2-dehydrogenase
MAKQISLPRLQIGALPETMDALKVAMLEPLGIAIHAVGLTKPRGA